MIAMVARTAFSLAAVLALMFLAARVARRGVRRSGGGALEVVARQQLGRTSSIAVVTVGGRPLLLGVTESGVSLLTELDPATLSVPDVVALPLEPSGERVARKPSAVRPTGALAGSVLSPATWRTAVDVLRDRTVRRGAA